MSDCVLFKPLRDRTAVKSGKLNLSRGSLPDLKANASLLQQ
ncbi:hypothetical protein [Paenibacillus vortex]|nr:hypothetical protein [Paenibacillus vortex]